MPTLSVGSATTVVTPALGSPVPGGLHDRAATGVHDDLFARAAAIEADPPLGLLAVDCVALHRDMVLAIRGAGEREAGIPAHRLFVAANRTRRR
jgi:hypothetical protein